VLYYEVKTLKFHRRRPDRGFGDAWPRFLRISGITSPCTPSERATAATPLISEEMERKTKRHTDPAVADQNSQGPASNGACGGMALLTPYREKGGRN